MAAETIRQTGAGLEASKAVNRARLRGAEFIPLQPPDAVRFPQRRGSGTPRVQGFDGFANAFHHLNDIGKSDPDLVVATLRRWHGEVRQSPDELDWMTRHALRSLVKSGHPGAMALLGFDPEVEVTLAALDVPTTIAIGDTLDIRATLEATSDTRALVDWVFWRRRANGALAAKVFKLRQVALRAGEPVTLSKSHRLRGDATTFRLYPGPHRIEIQVNGRVIGGADFELTE